MRHVTQKADSCDGPVKALTDCLQTNDMDSCRWYLDQLNACKAAAAAY